MLPLYATRIEDLGQGDFVKVDCAACHHVALLTPQSLLRASESDEYYQSSQFPSWTKGRKSSSGSNLVADSYLVSLQVRTRLSAGGRWIRTSGSGASGEADAILPVKDGPGKAVAHRREASVAQSSATADAKRTQ